MDTKLTLLYFNLRALAEAPQMMMQYRSAAYSYEMVWDYYGAPWSEMKSKMPFRQLPILIVDDKTEIAQSGSIIRFLAQHLDLMPDDAHLAAEVDAVFEASQDLFSPLNGTVNLSVGDVFTERRKTVLEALPPRLGDLERILARHSEAFFFGATPHYCDFGVFHHLDLAHFLDENLLADFPQLRAYMAAFRSIPQIAAYLESRPTLVDVGVAPKLIIDGTPKSTGFKAG